MFRFVIALLSLAFSLSAFAEPAAKPAAEKAEVFFVNLKDGQEVASPVKVKFGLKGKAIRPALQDVTDKTSGHHHLIIDGGPVPAGQPVITDDKHIHYGKGQTEADITLAPGEHTLTLQFADGAHLSYGEAMSATVKVKVKGPKRD